MFQYADISDRAWSGERVLISNENIFYLCNV